MPDSKAIAIERGAFYARKLEEKGIKLPEAAEKISRLSGDTHTRSGINNKTKGLRGIHLDEVPYFAKIVGILPSTLAWHFDKKSDLARHHDLFEEFTAREIDVDNAFTTIMSERVLEPEIREHDRLLVEKGTPEIDDKTLVLIKGENSGHWVRYVKPELSGGYTLYCYDKDNYPDQKLETLDNINIVGKVISVTRWL